MDEQLVLTAQTLKLNPDLQRAETPGDIFVIKNVPSRKYLTISSDEWNLLRNFAHPATVPDVLRSVILSRTCLPLREFYELILKAHRAGVLQAGREVSENIPARQWILSVGPTGPIILTILAIIVAFIGLATQPFPWPGTWPQPALIHLLIGWALLGVSLSVGQVLAASVLRAGGGEIYQPAFRWLRPVPYFGVNLDDASMTSRSTQAGIWCARLFPVIATSAALWFFQPRWGLFHVLGIVVMLRPFADGSVPALISVLCRGLVLDTQRNFLFSLNCRWHIRLRVGLSRVSLPYVTARLIWGLLWILLILSIALRAANQSLGDLFGTLAYWQEVSAVFGVAGLAAISGYVALPATRATWFYSRAKSREWLKSICRWVVKSSRPATEEQIARVLSESLLLRRLSVADRGDLRQCGKLRVIKAWQTFFRFAQQSTEVGIIISGKVTLYRRHKSGRGEKGLTLLEGDLFGAHALLDADRQQVQLKTQTPVVALMIPIEEFERRMLQILGAPLINDLVHKAPFLRTISFCKTWHPQAVARFAQLSSIILYHEGEVIVEDRQDTQQFYIVYEGKVLVKRKNRVRAKLRPGAYFGEVSLLQNGAAIADVIAKENTRCFLVSKADFLRFMTHNPTVGLQLEEISSHRLGHPIFPIKGHSFEVR